MKCFAQLNDMARFVFSESVLEETSLVYNSIFYFLEICFSHHLYWYHNFLVFCLFLLSLFHKPPCLSLLFWWAFPGLWWTFFLSSQLSLVNLGHPQDLISHLMTPSNSLWAPDLSIPLRVLRMSPLRYCIVTCSPFALLTELIIVPIWSFSYDPYHWPFSQNT